MTENFNLGDDAYNSVNREQIEAARAANNTWIFDDGEVKRELEKYVARGEASTAVAVLDRKTGIESGAQLVHIFHWEKEAPFIARERALVTKLVRVGRSTDQDIDTAALAPVNTEFYKAIIEGGILLTPRGNGEFNERKLSREEMLKHANLYPESASEAVETWLDAAKCEILAADSESSFDFLFEANETVKVLWYLGERTNPLAAAILTFKSPSSEVRAEHDKTQQKIKSKRQGDVNIAELQENFPKKIQYGLRHLLGVEGVSVEAEGVAFTPEMKSKFVTLFNPLWFADAVDTMHESFDFFRGASANS